MGATVEKMISDLELRFTGGKPSDDFEGAREQLRFWIDNANGALLPQWIMKVNGGQVPPTLIRRLDCLVVKTESPQCEGGCCTYDYIEFPKNPQGEPIVPITLLDDRGVIQMYQGVQTIYRLPSPTMLSVMTNLKNGATTPYFYRIADKLYLFNGVFTSYSRITVMCAFSDTSSLKDDDVYPTVDDLIPSILDEAEKIGRRQFTSTDLQDDGIPKKQ